MEWQNELLVQSILVDITQRPLSLKMKVYKEQSCNNINRGVSQRRKKYIIDAIRVSLTSINTPACRPFENEIRVYQELAAGVLSLADGGIQ